MPAKKKPSAFMTGGTGGQMKLSFGQKPLSKSKNDIETKGGKISPQKEKSPEKEKVVVDQKEVVSEKENQE